MTGISEDTMQSILEQSAALETGQKLTRRRRTTQQGTYFIQLNINLNKKLYHKVECRNFALERTSDYLERWTLLITRELSTNIRLSIQTVSYLSCSMAGIHSQLIYWVLIGILKKNIHIWLLVDNVGVAHGFRYIRFLTTYLVKERVFKLHFLSLGGTTSITYTQYFNKFQLIQVKKSEGLNRANPHDDYFEGRMIL